LTALAIAGCGQGGNTVATVAVDEPGHLAASMFPSGTWPLTVRSGIVRCEGASVIFKTNGTDYAVNGTALSQYPDMAPVRRIWRASREIPGTKINISPVLDAGLKLCE
jgi:hypothetical protein